MAATASARRSAGDSLLRISHACETLLAGFNSGQAAAVKSCMVSRERAVTVSMRPMAGSADKGAGSLDMPRDLLLPVEDVMAHRRARPSLLLPAWRAVGFAVGRGATTLLPAETSAKVGDAITRTVAEQYDANIRSMYEAKIEKDESEVKNLFKSQRDEPSRATITPDAGGNEKNASEGANDTRLMAVTGTLKSALRMAFDITGKV